mgnify:CR=1 FL=1
MKVGRYRKNRKENSADAAEEESLPTYEEEKVKLEQLRKAMIADAQTMANQITSTAHSEANGILDAAKQSAQQLFEEQRKLGYEEGRQQSEQELQAAGTGI